MMFPLESFPAEINYEKENCNLRGSTQNLNNVFWVSGSLVTGDLHLASDTSLMMSNPLFHYNPNGTDISKYASTHRVPII